MDSGTERTIVIAGTWHQFLNWCHENGLRPTDRKLISVPEGCADRIRGLSGPRRGGNLKLVKTGTWYERRDAGELIENLRISGFEE